MLTNDELNIMYLMKKMGTWDDLPQVERDLWNMRLAEDLKQRLTDLRAEYFKLCTAKKFDKAEDIDKAIKILDRSLDNVKRSISNNACEVSKASASGNKKFFILQR